MTHDPDAMTAEQLRDEVWYWRTEAAADLGFRLCEVENPDLRTDFRGRATLKRRVEARVSLLSNALSGDIFEACSICGEAIRPGVALIRDVDMGDCHAECMGDPEIKREGGARPGDTILVDPESVVGFDDEPDPESDGRLIAHEHSRLYTTDQIAAKLEMARAAIGRGSA